MSILEDIYCKYHVCEPIDEMPPDLCNKQREFFETVEGAMGLAFLEQYRENLAEERQFCDFLHFREGFRLGMALILEQAVEGIRQSNIPCKKIPAAGSAAGI